jgi:two-component system, chemotaxis family, CheB/CheR fusion protein
MARADIPSPKQGRKAPPATAPKRPKSAESRGEAQSEEPVCKVESLERALSDRKNLLQSLQIAAIFLDGELRIRSFTPAATEIFHLIDTDVGRPITDIRHRMAGGQLQRDVSRVLGTLSPFEQEVTAADGEATYIMRILPYRTRDDIVDGVVVTFLDITERKRNEEALAQFAAIIANSPDAIIALKPDGTITSWNAGAQRLYGFTADEAIGQPLSMLMPADRSDELHQILERLRRSPPGRALETERITKHGNRIHVSFTSVPIRNSGGKLVAAAVIERDVTEYRQSEEQQKMLLAELNHRVKNALATALSIASRTRKTSPSLDDYYPALEGRLRALASTHDLLAKNVWTGAHLRQIVMAELKPYDGEKDAFHLGGPDLFVCARAAVVLGMVFHELATNAAKYGALSDPRGQVQVRWGTDQAANDTFALEWQERGGPAPKREGKEGFGINFIERSIAYELQGTVDVKFEPQGVEVSVRAPMSELLGKPAKLATVAGHKK